MTRKFLVCFVLTLSTLSFALASNIDGKWKGKMKTPDNEMELTYTFKVVGGDTLIGSVQSEMGEIKLINGKVKGDTFSFDIEVNDMTIHHDCKVLEGSISMKVPGMQGEMMEIILTPVVEAAKVPVK